MLGFLSVLFAGFILEFCFHFQLLRFPMTVVGGLGGAVLGYGMTDNVLPGHRLVMQDPGFNLFSRLG